MARNPETDPKALLGELLRLARQQSSHKTQDALGRAIGLERTSVVRFEAGDRVPNVDVLGALLDACDVVGLARTAIEIFGGLGRVMID